MEPRGAPRGSPTPKIPFPNRKGYPAYGYLDLYLYFYVTHAAKISGYF